MNKRTPVLCGKCNFFFVTHNRYKPWGCTRFGFKSQALPSQVIFSTTGTDCAYFKQKDLINTRRVSQIKSERR